MRALFTLLLFVAAIFVGYTVYYNWNTTNPNPKPNMTPGLSVATDMPAIKDALTRIAQKTGVTIINMEPQDKDLLVTVEWIGDSAATGGDFLEAAVTGPTKVARTFDEKPSTETPRTYDAQGRSHFKQSFLLKF